MMPTEMVDVLPEAVSDDLGDKPRDFLPAEIAAVREALEQQWKKQTGQASSHDGVTPAPAASQAWSLGSVGAVLSSVVKVAAQAITFSRQAIVKGLACIGISFDQAANTHASDAANDSGTTTAENQWQVVEESRGNMLVHNALIQKINEMQR